jgi:hypothetical protein
MRKEREALLIAALAGFVIVGAGALVVQPTTGGKAQPVRALPVQQAVLDSSQFAVSQTG